MFLGVKHFSASQLLIYPPYLYDFRLNKVSGIGCINNVTIGKAIGLT